jgi:hypothetical protein
VSDVAEALSDLAELLTVCARDRQRWITLLQNWSRVLAGAPSQQEALEVHRAVRSVVAGQGSLSDIDLQPPRGVRLHRVGSQSGTVPQNCSSGQTGSSAVGDLEHGQLHNLGLSPSAMPYSWRQDPISVYSNALRVFSWGGGQSQLTRDHVAARERQGLCRRLYRQRDRR